MPLHFSLSSSGGMALVGIAVVPIGVDVEKLPSWETVQDCSPALHPGERSELASAKATERKECFGQIDSVFTRYPGEQVAVLSHLFLDAVDAGVA
ncbi:hypothetical protein ACGFZC_33575 [[Kitasatospora] papulosa]|uniref:hypothetical protein n=1 Tax=[Kitasatospora] papulosa TaxID=1464011 RepID=UPI00371C719C